MSKTRLCSPALDFERCAIIIGVILYTLFCHNNKIDNLHGNLLVDFTTIFPISGFLTQVASVQANDFGQ